MNTVKLMNRSLVIVRSQFKYSVVASSCVVCMEA
ncbi:hypothetical protein J2T56_001387 [Natronobacillus azotifigens]